MVYVERDCVIEREGRKFEAGGAVVAPDYVIGYVIGYVGKPIGDGMGCERFGDSSRRELTDWHGNRIGHIALGAGWRVRSYIGSRMFQAYATVNGVTYTGRTFGEGMSFRGKRCAKQGKA